VEDETQQELARHSSDGGARMRISRVQSSFGDLHETSSRSGLDTRSRFSILGRCDVMEKAKILVPKIHKIHSYSMYKVSMRDKPTSFSQKVHVLCTSVPIDSPPLVL